jgi:hypothetical protein
VTGLSTAGDGVRGQSISGRGVFGYSSSDIGVFGGSGASDQPGSLGTSLGNSTGVLGYSGANPLPAAKARPGSTATPPRTTSAGA